MSSHRPLFVTGTARGGTNLVARMVDAHRDAALAVDPFFPLFRSLRDALLRAGGIDVPPGLALQDYYCDDARIAALDTVQAGDLGVAVDPAELPALRARLAERCAVDAGDVVPYLGLVDGADYRALVDGALSAVAAARGSAPRWIGTKEVWIVELFAALARAYPEARFVLLHRDPRAVLASMLTLARDDPTQLAHPLSYARHWRKAVSFGVHYARDPLFAERLLVMRYEDVAADPRAAARSLCAFLGVDEDDAMLGAGGFPDRSTGGAWRGNSSYPDAELGIAADRVDRWRTALDPRAHALVELVCGPELALAGYEPEPADADEDALLAYLAETSREPHTWRSDLGDPERDLACEHARLALLVGGGDEAAVRRGFLFDDVFRACREPVAR